MDRKVLHFAKYEQIGLETGGVSFEGEKYYLGQLIYLPKEGQPLLLEEVKGERICDAVRKLTVAMPDVIYPSPFAGKFPRMQKRLHSLEGLTANELKEARRQMSMYRKVYRPPRPINQNDEATKAKSTA